MIDENLDWQSHIKLVESKISKNIGDLLKGSLHLNKKCLLMIYFSFIHSYINYGNIVWTSTSQTKLKKYLLIKNMLFELYIVKEKETHARPLLK